MTMWFGSDPCRVRPIGTGNYSRTGSLDARVAEWWRRQGEPPPPIVQVLRTCVAHLESTWAPGKLLSAPAGRSPEATAETAGRIGSRYPVAPRTRGSHWPDACRRVRHRRRIGRPAARLAVPRVGGAPPS